MNNPFSHVRVGVGVLVRRAMPYSLLDNPHRIPIWEVLFGLRKGSHAPGTWAFPGGNLERNESVAACAAREVAEETGLAFPPERFTRLPFYTLTVHQDPDRTKPDRHYVTLFASLDLDEGFRVAAGYSVPHEAKILEPEKCAEWRWARRSRTGGNEHVPKPLAGWMEDLVAMYDLWSTLPRWGAPPR